MDEVLDKLRAKRYKWLYYEFISTGPQERYIKKVLDRMDEAISIMEDRLPTSYFPRIEGE